MRIFADEMLEFQRQFELISAQAVSLPSQEQAPSRENPITVGSSRYFTMSHHYFFELNLAKNGGAYITIDQRRKLDGEYIGEKINIFIDAIPEFLATLKEFITQALNLNDLKTPLPLFEATFNLLYPLFFHEMQATNDWQMFERYTFYLLKLLGIQNIYTFLEQSQAGKADGFFTVGNLAVLYDCTLASDRIGDYKAAQINNYCNLLSTGRIEVASNVIEEFHSYHHRQVWVITRRKTQNLRFVNRVEVKEVGINQLMELYEKRLMPEMSFSLFLNNLIGL